MKQKRILCLLLAVLLALGALTGCGGAAPAAPTPEPVSPTPDPTPSALFSEWDRPSVSAETLSARPLDAFMQGECLCACLMIRGRTLLAYGLAEPVDGGKQYDFVELFTGERLFRYDAWKDGSPHRWGEGSVPFSPLSNLFDSSAVLIDVDNWSIDANNFDCDAALNEQYRGIATLRDAFERYYHVIPEEMRFVVLSDGEGSWTAFDAQTAPGEEPSGRAQDRAVAPTSDKLRENYPPAIIPYDSVELSEEEYRAAYDALKIKDPDEDLDSGSFFTAGFFINRKPHVMYGVVMQDEEDGYFVFIDRFSGREMFRYLGGDGSPISWTKREDLPSICMRRAEFEGIHPYFLTGDIELCFVGLSFEVGNFIDCLGYDNYGHDTPEEEAKLAFFGEHMPAGSGELWSTEKVAWSYLNLVPRPLWVTAEDLEAAEAAG